MSSHLHYNKFWHVFLTVCLYVILCSRLPSVPLSCFSITPSALQQLFSLRVWMCMSMSFSPSSLMPSCLPTWQSLSQPYLSVSEPWTSLPLSLSQPCSSSCCFSLKVSVVRGTQHVSICSNWPVSALCSSAHSPLNCLLFHLQRVFLFLATDSLTACKEFTKTPALLHGLWGEKMSWWNPSIVTVRGALIHFQLSAATHIYAEINFFKISLVIEMN